MGNDAILGVHGTALLLREKRSAILASNLAHTSTPNYKARDFDSDNVLRKLTNYETSKSAGGEITPDKTHPSHISFNENFHESFLKYRIPHHPSADGNTVDMDLEKAAFAENALRYQASLTFLRGRVSGLLAAINGE